MNVRDFQRFLCVAAVTAPLVAAPLAAQVPSRVVELENARSRSCVDILSRLVDLDGELAPLAERAQRLAAIGQAIALEDERIVAELDSTDTVESAVMAWFAEDQALAQRYVATLAEELQTQRGVAREGIATTLGEAIAAIQAEAGAMIEASGNLPDQAARCDGAIFVRPVVAEACATAKGPLCDAVALPASQVRDFRFVDNAEDIWDVTEVRPWTMPTPFTVSPAGQLDGARTIGYARTGNVVVSVAFSPMLRDRTEITADEATRFQSTSDSLGLGLDHPDIAISPSISLRATLPEPLADESSYVLHFGPPGDADVLWSGAPGTGEPIEANVAIGAQHVTRLQAGEPITFSALRDPDASVDPVFTIELAAVNQAQASRALLGYMAQQMKEDLSQLLQPRGD